MVCLFGFIMGKVNQKICEEIFLESAPLTKHAGLDMRELEAGVGDDQDRPVRDALGDVPHRNDGRSHLQPELVRRKSRLHS